MDQLLTLQNAMMTWETGEPKRMHHFVKVHYFAKMIAVSEKLDPKTRLVLEVAALTHNIGEKPAKAIDFKASPELIATESVKAARVLLEGCGFAKTIVDRVCYMIANRHNPEKLTGMDLQILAEAELLVNLYESLANKDTVHSALDNVFKTKTGIDLFNKMYCRKLED